MAGAYTPAGVPGVRRYTLGDDGGVLPGEAVSALPFPTFLARRAPGTFGFAVGETTGTDHAPFGTDPEQTGRPGTVWSRPTGGTGADGWTHRSSGGELPTHLGVHPGGRWLVVSNYGCDPVPGRIVVFPVDEAGRLGAPTSTVTHRGSGPVAGRQSLAHVHSTSFAPDGNSLLAADLGADELVVYAFDPVGGTLTRTRAVRTPPGWGPRYLQWSADGATVYVVGELAGEVGAFAWSGTDRTLEMVASTRTSRTGAGVLPSDMHLAPDADLLYVANRDATDTLAVLTCADPGALELVAEVPTRGRWPRHFALAPHGRMLVVANQHSDDITVLRRDADGVPSEHLSTTAHPAPSFIGFE